MTETTYSFTVEQSRPLDIQRIIQEAPKGALFIQLTMGHSAIVLISPLATRRMIECDIGYTHASVEGLSVIYTPQCAWLNTGPAKLTETPQSDWTFRTDTTAKKQYDRLRAAETKKTKVQVTVFEDDDGD